VHGFLRRAVDIEDPVHAHELEHRADGAMAVA
jgi:hypothetical protein